MATPENAMEFIWERIPKQKDGKTIRYIKGDLEYLYTHGFVDAKRYTIKQWKQAFDPYKQKDESYVLSKEQFLSLRMYRYEGPSHEMFDAGKIENGNWSDEALQALYDRSIGVASNIPNETFWTYINALKKTGDYTDAKTGLFIMNDAVKLGLDALVRKYPSPRTLLELEVKRIRKERDEKLAGHQKDRDKSGFTVGQSEVENKAAAFQTLQSSKTVKEDAAKEKAKETIDLKSLKKPTGKFRG